jgi:hypothetical protein
VSGVVCYGSVRSCMKTAPKILLVFVRNPDFSCPKVRPLVQLSVPHISAVILVHLGKFYFTVSIHLTVRRPGPSSNFLPLEVLPTVLRLTPVCRAKLYSAAQRTIYGAPTILGRSHYYTEAISSTPVPELILRCSDFNF